MNKYLKKTLTVLLLGLLFSTGNIRADDLDYGETDYEKAYTSQDNISEKKVALLTKSMSFQSVISRVGPPTEKIEKSVKQEDIWLYNSFAAIFRKGQLVNVKLNPNSNLFSHLVLDSSFDLKKPAVVIAKTNSKVNPDIEGLLKDFGLADGKGQQSAAVGMN